MSALRREMRKIGFIERYTNRELLQEMEILTMIKYSNKYGHLLTKVVTTQQREILKVLNIELTYKI